MNDQADRSREDEPDEGAQMPPEEQHGRPEEIDPGDFYPFPAGPATAQEPKTGEDVVSDAAKSEDVTVVTEEVDPDDYFSE